MRSAFHHDLMSTKHAQQTHKTLALCAQQHLRQDDIWYIRDRLHERCSFFRLWPSQLQQLICRLARPMHWVQNEILASQGSKPTSLCFILEGEAGIAVRSAPGSSLLRDVAGLKSGDSFGELSLLGVQHHPAFIVVRSKHLLALAVDAQQLAQAMLRQQKQRAPGISPGAAAQGQQDEEPSISMDMLYKLICETGHDEKSALNLTQQEQVKRVQAQQLQSAATAEKVTVGMWLAPPHTRQQKQQPLSPAAAVTTRDIATQGAAPHGLGAGQNQSAFLSQLQAETGHVAGRHIAEEAGFHRPGQEKHMQDRADVLTPGMSQAHTWVAHPKDAAVVAHEAAAGQGRHCSNGSGDNFTKQSSMRLRARHSAILHVAMMKAATNLPEQPG